jgi:hypothetical protein
MFLWFHVLVMKGYVLKNNLNVFQINCQDNFLYIFKFKLNLFQHHTYVQVVYIILVKINHSYIKYQIKILKTKSFH